MHTEAVTVMSWNVEKGIHWEEAADWVRAQAPDLYFHQEVQPGDFDALSERLGMDGYLAAPRPGSSNDNAIFLRRGGPLAFDNEFRHDWAPWHAPANVTVRFRDADGTLSPRTISCVSVHTCYWNGEYRVTEAKWLSTLAKPGWLAWVFGDWNSFRVGEREDGWWEHYADKAFVANRTYTDGAGNRRTDDRPDREMLDAGFIELGWYADAQLQQKKAMSPTAGYRAHPGRPADDLYCIDRGYQSPELASALRSFEVLDTPALRQKSDHLPVIARYSKAQLREILHRAPDLYTPR